EEFDIVRAGGGEPFGDGNGAVIVGVGIAESELESGFLPFFTGNSAVLVFVGCGKNFVTRECCGCSLFGGGGAGSEGETDESACGKCQDSCFFHNKERGLGDYFRTTFVWRGRS